MNISRSFYIHASISFTFTHFEKHNYVREYNKNYKMHYTTKIKYITFLLRLLTHQIV